MPTFRHAQLKLSGNGSPETDREAAPHPPHMGLCPACPPAALKPPSISHMLWNLCMCGNHCPERPSPSHPTLFSHPQAVLAAPPPPPAPLGWVQSALTTLSCTHSFPACFLHRTRSQERARISPCSSFLSHQCQVEKMLKSVCLVNCAKRRENVLESHPAPVSSPVEQFLLVTVEDAAGRHSSPQQSQPKTPLEINCTFPNNLRA